MSIDIEQLKILKEIISPSKTFDTTDHDSFATFTNGMSKFWYLIIAIAGVALWLVNGLNDVRSDNTLQSRDITTLTQNMSTLAKTVGDLQANTQSQFNLVNTSNNQVLNELSLIRKDIEILKNK